jgi:hypothetical protein
MTVILDFQSLFYFTFLFLLFPECIEYCSPIEGACSAWWDKRPKEFMETRERLIFSSSPPLCALPQTSFLNISKDFQKSGQ